MSHNSQNTCRLCNWFTSTLHSCISFINSLLVKLYNLRITFVQLKNLSRSVSVYPRDALIYKIHLILKTLTIKHDTSRQFFSTSHARGRYALPISTPVDFVSVCTLSFVGILFLSLLSQFVVTCVALRQTYRTNAVIDVCGISVFSFFRSR